jgi:hypothetical protein
MKIWCWPIVIAALSLAGLLTGLIFDDFGDIFAWLALSVPVALCFWFGWYRHISQG